MLKLGLSDTCATPRSRRCSSIWPCASKNATGEPTSAPSADSLTMRPRRPAPRRRSPPPPTAPAADDSRRPGRPARRLSCRSQRPGSPKSPTASVDVRPEHGHRLVAITHERPDGQVALAAQVDEAAADGAGRTGDEDVVHRRPPLGGMLRLKRNRLCGSRCRLRSTRRCQSGGEYAERTRCGVAPSRSRKFT